MTIYDDTAAELVGAVPTSEPPWRIGILDHCEWVDPLSNGHQRFTAFVDFGSGPIPASGGLMFLTYAQTAGSSIYGQRVLVAQVHGSPQVIDLQGSVTRVVT